MSFADLTPEAYKAAENAAWQIVKQFEELNLEYDEVRHDALIYLAERPEYVELEMANGYAVRNMTRDTHKILSDRMATETRHRRQSVSHEDWSERMAAHGW